MTEAMAMKLVKVLKADGAMMTRMAVLMMMVMLL